MSQIAQPIEDLLVESWGATPLWSKIDELVADDTDVISPTNVFVNKFEVLLSKSLSAPWAQGIKAVRLRLRRTGDVGVVGVELRQGSTVIASRNFFPPDTFVEVAMVLSAAEAAAITDLADLRVRVSSGCIESFSSAGQEEECCEETPYQYTMSGNSCEEFNGTVTMRKSHMPCYWVNEGGVILSELYPVAEDDAWHLSISKIGARAVYKADRDSWDCDGCNVMELYQVQGSCSGWPETVTVCYEPDP